MKRAITALAAAAGATAAFAAPASADVVPDRVIVKYAAGTSSAAKERAADRAGLRGVVGRVTGLGAQVVRVSGDPAAAAKRLEAQPGVVYAEPDQIMTATSVPNDARFGELYGLDNGNDADLNAPEAWDIAYGAGNFPSSGGATVGIVDTGIDTDHPDLAGKTVSCAGVNSFGIGGLILADPTIVDGKCEDGNDHGTHVAGTITGNANNGIGVAGVAPDAQLAICKGLSDSGSGPTSGIANCITHLADEGVDVISMSLGGGSSTTMQQAVQRAWDNGNGALVVAAAGNDGTSNVSYPAGYPEAMSVAATDRNDQKASFSQFNSDVEIAAAGVDVLSTVPGGGYEAFSGTSMATPHVAGAAAVVKSANPGLTAAQLRSRLQQGVDDLGTPGRDPQFGFGRVDLVKALG